jgi:hypothetical protein
MFLDTEIFGKRSPNDFTAPDELNDRLHYLVVRTGDGQLEQCEQEIYRWARRWSELGADDRSHFKGSPQQTELNKVAEAFYVSLKSFIDRGEQLLLLEFGISARDATGPSAD